MKKIIDETSVEETSGAKTKSGLKGKLIGLVILIVLIGGGYYAVTNFLPGQDPAVKAQAEAEKKIASTVAAVGALMSLPQGEMPQMAEIKDAALAAKEQPFYNGSQNGDLVLVYPNARKAIVYSPARNIIVNAGPILTDQAVTSTPTPVVPTTPETTKKK